MLIKELIEQLKDLPENDEIGIGYGIEGFINFNFQVQDLVSFEEDYGLVPFFLPERAKENSTYILTS